MSEENLRNIEVNDAEEVSGEVELEDGSIDLPSIQNRDFGSLVNVPYKKIYTKEGIEVKVITKDNPYLNPFPNRAARRRLARNTTKFPKNNGKGTRLIIKKVGKTYLKFTTVRQKVGKKTITHTILTNAK